MTSVMRNVRNTALRGFGLLWVAFLCMLVIFGMILPHMISADDNLKVAAGVVLCGPLGMMILFGAIEGSKRVYSAYKQYREEQQRRSFDHYYDNQ